MKYVFLAFLMLFGTAQADEIYQEVTDEKGDVIGVVSTNDLTWRGCTEEDATQGRCDEADPVVCMTYSNDCYRPIVCDLTVSAFLAEPWTGFTKKVTDTRSETVFYNQTHEVCFNFAKDRYHLWHLLDTSDPVIECASL